MAIATSDCTNAPPMDQENSVDDVNRNVNNISVPNVSKLSTEENGESVLSSSAMNQVDCPKSVSDESVLENGCDNGSADGNEDNDVKESENGVDEVAKESDANSNQQANGLMIKTGVDQLPNESRLHVDEEGDCAPTGSGDSNYSDSEGSPSNENAVLHGDDTSGEKLSRTNLYIRGLGEEFNDKKLFDLCKKFGQIVSTKAIMHKQSMICKGYGFVDFSTEEEARRAVVELQNQGIPAQMARQQEQDLTNIYISNLPKNFDEKKLETVFQKFGTVVSTRILRDQNGVTKRVGFVRMESQEMCESVIAKVHNKPLEEYPDCKLLCKFADAGKRRKPFYNTGSAMPGAGVYDHFDHTYHQHNHHSYNYSNHHQSAYNSSLYANFPKGYNSMAGPHSGASAATGVSPHAANIALNGVWPSAGAAAAPNVANFGSSGLNAMASTGAFANYYNLLLTNPNAAAAAALSLGAVTNNAAAAGSAAVLAGTGPLAAAASLGGAPFFQNPAAAANQLASPAANTANVVAAANHANMVNSPNSSASFITNSHSSQHSEASTMQSSSAHLNNQQQSSGSAMNGAAGTGVGLMGNSGGQGSSLNAELAAFYQQHAATGNPHFLSQSMHHLNLQQRGASHQHNQNTASNSHAASSTAANAMNNRTVTSASLFNNGGVAAGNGLQAMLHHANSSSSPLDAPQSSADDSQRAQQFTLNGSANTAAVNGAYAAAHIQMATPSANANGGGVSSHAQQASASQQNPYWAAMLPPAAQYHAALVQAQQQHSTNDMGAAVSTGPNVANASGVGATNSANSNSAASANSANNLHMFAYNRAAANSQVQF